MIMRMANIEDVQSVAVLAQLLWPRNTLLEMEEEMNKFINDDSSAIFIATKNGTDIGFAECALRHDYVEGTSGSPVGYLEGIYVIENNRKCGVARELIRICEQWAKEAGASEFASDCILENISSYNFHLKVGFTVANKIVCFTKKL